MSEPETSALDVVSNGLNGLPVSVKASFLKATLNLLGELAAIPAAKLRQFRQGTEDATSARSTTSAILAKAVAEAAMSDPLVMQAAAEVFLPTTVRKAKNRLSVAQSAAEHLMHEPVEETSRAQAAPPDDDWMNTFARFAEDASSERMQALFGRILAGQVLRPGAFGLATLRALSELDQTIANDFTYAWAQCIENSVDYSLEWRRGEDFSMWKRLAEAGLMGPTSVCRYPPLSPPVFPGDFSLWGVMQSDRFCVNVVWHVASNISWEHIEFTRVGREIGMLIEKPDYEKNIRKAAARLPQPGISQIELHEFGISHEILWRAPNPS